MLKSKEFNKAKMLHNMFCQMKRFNPLGDKKKKVKREPSLNTKADTAHKVLYLIPSEMAWCYKSRYCVWDYHSLTLMKLFLLLFCYISLKKNYCDKKNNCYLKKPLLNAFFYYSHAYSWLKSTLYKGFQYV